MEGGFLIAGLLFRDQDNVNFRLKERLRLVTSWRSDLQQELNSNKKETACLEEKMRQLEHAMKETERPMRTAQDCLKNRYVKQEFGLVELFKQSGRTDKE